MRSEVIHMLRCTGCNTIVDRFDDVCPVCGADSSKFQSELAVSRLKREEFEMLLQERHEISSSSGPAGVATPGQSAFADPMQDPAYVEALQEADEVYRRGMEYMDNARKWTAGGNRSRARESYQRAFRYFERALKLNPSHDGAKQAKSRCLGKLI